MAVRGTESLWKEHLRDPTHLMDEHETFQVIPPACEKVRISSFTHRQTRNNLHGGQGQGEDVRIAKEGQIIFKNKDGFPDTEALLYSVRDCIKRKDWWKGGNIHAKILETGVLKTNIYVSTALLRIYMKCGAVTKAQEVFNELLEPDIISWNALITGYVLNGLGYEALHWFDKMQDKGCSPDTVTLIYVLKACGSIGATENGKEVHAKVTRQGLLEKNYVLGTAVVDMYVKCGALARAQKVFDELPDRDVVCWNALICGYAQYGLGHQALRCFERMRDEGFSPNSVTFVCTVKACASIGAVEKGEKLHAELSRQGLLTKDVMLGTAVVDMYAKCGALSKAREVFNELHVRNIVCWTALLAGYVQYGFPHEALEGFHQMRDEGFSPTADTFSCALKACGSTMDVEKGEALHAEVRAQGLLKKDFVLGTALLDMYAKCGLLAKAQEVFNELPARNVISWNALIAGYAQYDLGHEALKCLKQMQAEGFSPDVATFTSILRACGSIGAVEKGEEIHAEVSRQGLLQKKFTLGTALVDMYAKCGVLAKAQKVFDELLVQDALSWTALIAGYAQLGQVKTVFDSFEKMVDVGIKPDLVTFTVLLTACGHAGEVEQGQRYYDSMRDVYRILPSSEHHACMVDLYSRAGYFDKAISVIERVPVTASCLLWRALLGTCRKWGNVELGKWAFEHVIQLDEKYAGAYVCMSNIYAEAGMQDEADKVEALRREKGAWVSFGRSWWTDSQGNIHSFTVGDENHPQSKAIAAKLNDIGHRLTLEGYSGHLHWLSQCISDNGKETVLCGHSENMAIACALINTPEGTAIRVATNMQACADCHFATLLISKIERRIIQVNYVSRIHIFRNGWCICGEHM